jgi:hypothetical protein
MVPLAVFSSHEPNGSGSHPLYGAFPGALGNIIPNLTSQKGVSAACFQLFQTCLSQIQHACILKLAFSEQQRSLFRRVLPRYLMEASGIQPAQEHMKHDHPFLQDSPDGA